MDCFESGSSVCAKSTTMTSWDYHCVIGAAGVGKTNLLLRLTEETWSEGSEPTIGVEFGSKLIKLANGKTVKTHAWDTAGQEAFRSITRSYFRGAEGALLCFDLSHRPSWLAVPQWYQDLVQFGEENIVVTLVGTKLDLISEGKKERQVSLEEIEAFCKEHGGLQYIETSSKLGTNVEEAFAQTAQLIHERIEQNKIRRPQTRGSSLPSLAQTSADALSRKGCC